MAEKQKTIKIEQVASPLRRCHDQRDPDRAGLEQDRPDQGPTGYTVDARHDLQNPPPGACGRQSAL